MKEHHYFANYSKDDIDLICRKALQKWGKLSQVLMTIEELSELIQTLAKADRKVNGSDVEEIASEIADVKLMLKQAQLIFGINDIAIASLEEEKLDRLKKLLEEGKVESKSEAEKP